MKTNRRNILLGSIASLLSKYVPKLPNVIQTVEVGKNMWYIPGGKYLPDYWTVTMRIKNGKVILLK